MAVETDILIAIVSASLGAIAGAVAGGFYAARAFRRRSQRKFKQDAHRRMLSTLDDIVMISHTLAATLKVDLDTPSASEDRQEWMGVLSQFTGQIGLFAGGLAADQAMQEIFPNGVGAATPETLRRSAHQLRAKTGEILLLRIAEDSRELVQQYAGFLLADPSGEAVTDLDRFLDELGEVQVALAARIGREALGLKTAANPRGSSKQIADLLGVLEKLEGALLKDLQRTL